MLPTGQADGGEETSRWYHLGFYEDKRPYAAGLLGLAVRSAVPFAPKNGDEVELEVEYEKAWHLELAADGTASAIEQLEVPAFREDYEVVRDCFWGYRPEEVGVHASWWRLVDADRPCAPEAFRADWVTVEYVGPRLCVWDGPAVAAKALAEADAKAAAKAKAKAKAREERARMAIGCDGVPGRLFDWRRMRFPSGSF